MNSTPAGPVVNVYGVPAGTKKPSPLPSVSLPTRRSPAMIR